MSLDKPITLKRAATRNHIHWYDLRLKVKQAKTEDEEFSFFATSSSEVYGYNSSGRPSSTIPPFFELDRNDKLVPDLTAKFKVSDLDSTPLLKRYFQDYLIIMIKAMFTVV